MSERIEPAYAPARQDRGGGVTQRLGDLAASGSAYAEGQSMGCNSQGFGGFGSDRVGSGQPWVSCGKKGKSRNASDLAKRAGFGTVRQLCLLP